MTCAGFSSATLDIPFILPVVFVCAWVFVRSFKNITWEIIIFALIYDLKTQQHDELHLISCNNQIRFLQLCDRMF